MSSKKTLARAALNGGAPTFILALLAAPVAGLAQTPATTTAAPTTAAVAVDDAGSIIITGSRIARSELQGPVPVAILSDQAIRDSGAGNIQDVLADLPAVGQNVSRASSNFSTTGTGTATVNLRNLGSTRTLVLVNGRRFVAGIPGTSIVDLNTIPTDLISRVDVVTGGASAVYGSEAIAGVVNFTMNDRLDGIIGRVQGNVSDKGDAGRQYISIGAGTNFSAGRGHVQVYGQYENDEGLRSINRSFSQADIPNRSSFAQQGLFSLSGAFAGAGASGAITPGTETFTFSGDNTLKAFQSANIDGYNRNADRYLSVPVERTLGAASGHYEVSDGLTLYAEGQYAKTKSRSGLEPLAVAFIDLPNFAGIPVTNPFIPTAIRNAMIANGIDALPFIRRSNDIFDRSNANDRDTWRLVGGARGGFGDGLRYDIYYTHGETKAITSSGIILGPRYANALGAVAGAGGPVCSINVDADPNNNDASCVPINIFGFNSVSSAAAAYVTNNGQRSTYDARVKQDLVSGSVSGEIFQLPGGPLAFAVGAEYRHESSREDFDQATNDGLTLGNRLSDTIGRFNVKEGFVEVVAPILRDVPLAYYLGVEAAARHAEYSTVGGVWSWKAGGEYAPIRDIRFRAIYAEASRAPNIAELFSAQSETFPAVTDPCDQREGNGDGAAITKPSLSAACRAIPAIAAAVAGGGFVYSTAQIQTINGFVGGNPALNVEKAKTLTAGIVLRPSWLSGFSLSADYYSIKVENAIGIIGQQTSLDECFEGGGGELFCGNVIRNGSGRVTTVNALNLNTGSLLVSGVDVQGRYVHEFGGVNAIDLTILWNHRIKQQQTSFPGGPTQDELGQLDCFSCGRLGTGFKDRVNVSTTLSLGRLSVNYRVNYLGPVVDNFAAAVPIRVGAYTYHDLQLRLDIDKQRSFAFYVGVDNIGDKKPPIFGDTNPVTFPGTQTSANSYDLYGRMLYAGAAFKF